jgi:hypothetical protein
MDAACGRSARSEGVLARGATVRVTLRVTPQPSERPRCRRDRREGQATAAAAPAARAYGTEGQRFESSRARRKTPDSLGSVATRMSPAHEPGLAAARLRTYGSERDPIGRFDASISSIPALSRGSTETPPSSRRRAPARTLVVSSGNARTACLEHARSDSFARVRRSTVALPGWTGISGREHH